jgi:hypothetical protein
VNLASVYSNFAFSSSYFQVRVLYSPQEWAEGTSVDDITDWVDLTRYDQNEKKVMSDTPLLVNIKGCGYPPAINCRDFAAKYENKSESQETFPCYYSQVNPWIVLESYTFGESVGDVIASILIPNGIFMVCLVVLLYWYCPYCQAKVKKYEKHKDAKESELG